MSSSNLVLKGLFVDPQGLPTRSGSHLSLDTPLLFLGLTLSRCCNYRCRYCAQEAGRPAPQEVSGATLRELIREGADLGVQSVILAGAGEPLLDPAFHDVVRTTAELGLTTVLYTNGSQISPAVGEFLYTHDVSISLKLDTLDESCFNWLTGCHDGFRRTMRGLENLFAVGYGERECLPDGHSMTRLAVNAVVTCANLSDLIDLARYCDQLGIKLFLDNLSLVGRAADNWRDLITTPKEYLEACAKINSSLGYEAVGHSLDRAEACILWQYGIVIYFDGEARVCYDDPAIPRIGSIYEHPLKELVSLKQRLHPPMQSDIDCPLKCALRERLWRKVGSTLPGPEAAACFGKLAAIQQFESA